MAIDTAWQSLAQLKQLVALQEAQKNTVKKEPATATKSATGPNGKKMTLNLLNPKPYPGHRLLIDHGPISY